MKKSIPPFRVISIALVLSLIGLLSTGVLHAGNPKDEFCEIRVTVDPISPHSAHEADTIMLVVRAHYESGPPRTVRLLGRDLPRFTDGCIDVSDYCAGCVIEDTIMLLPGYCSAGDYDFSFIGIAESEPPAGDYVSDTYDYHLTIRDTDRPCHLRAPDTVSVEAGGHLQFNVKLFDDDRECPHAPELVWDYSGYPFDHGAGLFDSGRYIRTFSWNPTEGDVGRHRATIVASFGASTCERQVIILVLPLGDDCMENAPYVIPEPEFTRGLSNTIYYRPQCGAYEHELCYFDFEQPDHYLGCRITPTKSAAQEDGLVEELVSGLEDGHKYGYFATARFIEYPDSVALSNMTSSVQDASPPHPVTTTTATADSGGVIFVDWYGVVDDISFVDYYEVYRRYNGQPYELRARIPAEDPNTTATPYRYVESLGDGSGLVEGYEYHYMVDAVDIVGNRGDGVETPAVVPDSTRPCVPDVSVEYDYHFFFRSYIMSAECGVWGQSNCPDLQSADFIRFQAVRDSVKYFDDAWQPGYKFFASDWLVYDSDSVRHVFDFQPPDVDESYVHGHTYYIRAQAKDSVGNVSRWFNNGTAVYWSRPDSVIVDLFPPDDISNLRAYSDLDFTDSTAIVRLTWDPAADPVSGLDEYHVYRKVGDGVYEHIASVDTSGYVDADVDVGARVVLCYRIGSIDNVGHVFDYAASAWEACVRPNLGPAITVDCDAVVGDTCLTGGDSARIPWDGYITDGVDHYLALCNGAEYRQSDGAATSMYVPTAQDGEYSVAVRAVFINGTVSVWSNTVSFVRDGTPPEPIDSIWIDLPGDRPVRAYLRWNEPYDATGVEGYRVQRKSEHDPWDMIGEVRFHGYRLWPTPETCTVYQEYTYTAFPKDQLGNIQDSGNAELTTRCRKAPIMDTLTIEGGNITANWLRSTPSLSMEWYDSVLVTRHYYSDGVAYTEDTVFLVVQDTGCTFSANEMGPGYYEFQVMEIPTDLDFDIVSLWSKPKGIAYDYAPLPVDTIIAQPQPMPPDSVEACVGRVALWWRYDNPISIRCFKLIRYADGKFDRENCVRPRPNPIDDSFFFVDTGICPHVHYRYCLVAVDRNYLESDSVCIETEIRPPWVYTPKVVPFHPPFFNTDSLTVSWKWIDSIGGQYIDVDTTFGAVRCSVEVSIDSTFSNNVWTVPSTSAELRKLSIPLPVNIFGGIRTVYCRVMAWDRFDNQSPWSTEYEPLDCESTTYDIIPPSAVAADGRLITTIADSSALPGVVDVRLDWLPAWDTAAGVSHYVIYRDRNDGNWDSIGRVDHPGTYFIDDTVRVAGLGSCGYRYTVRPFDIIGNQQAFGNVVECLVPVSAPQGLRADSTRDITWNHYSDDPADAIYAECSCNESDLGTVWIAEQDRESWRYVSALIDSLHFNTGGSFDACDHVYFHIKAIRDGMESPWSEVAVYPPVGSAPIADDNGIPDEYDLRQNYPNPFNPVTKINLSLPLPGFVSLKIYNIKGELIRTLIAGNMEAGRHGVLWDGTDADGDGVASGIYIYRVKTGNFSESRKMILLR